MCLAPRFEIVSLRNSGSSWRALLLEGEQLGNVHFSAPPETSSDQMRALIHETAGAFEPDRSALAQFREREAA